VSLVTRLSSWPTGRRSKKSSESPCIVPNMSAAGAWSPGGQPRHDELGGRRAAGRPRRRRRQRPPTPQRRGPTTASR
jgi:hypothetical protein